MPAEITAVAQRFSLCLLLLQRGINVDNIEKSLPGLVKMARNQGIDLDISDKAGRRVKGRCYRIAVCDDKEAAVTLMDSVIEKFTESLK